MTAHETQPQDKTSSTHSTQLDLTVASRGDRGLVHADVPALVHAIGLARRLSSIDVLERGVADASGRADYRVEQRGVAYRLD